MITLMGNQHLIQKLKPLSQMSYFQSASICICLEKGQLQYYLTNFIPIYSMSIPYRGIFGTQWNIYNFTFLKGPSLMFNQVVNTLWLLQNTRKQIGKLGAKRNFLKAEYKHKNFTNVVQMLFFSIPYLTSIYITNRYNKLFQMY